MFTMQDAERELEMAGALNPGKWVDHSRATAQNARLIAEKVEGMDAEKAYCMGLLHDIGRRVGVVAIRHILEGFYYMNKIGQPEIARICLTHSFPGKGSDTYFGKYDCTEEEAAYQLSCAQKLKAAAQTMQSTDVHITLSHVPLSDDFVRSLQYAEGDLTADSLSEERGMFLRLIDVALRYGVPEFAPEKWKASMANKKHFDELCGCNIYTLLPNVMENSYEDLSG